MDLNLSDKVAFVTGGGGALGGVTLRALAAEGAAVAVCDINEQTAVAVADSLTKAGYNAIPVVGDVTRKDSIGAAFAAAEAALGPIDILVNNAGFSRDSYLTKMDEANWDLVHDVVLKGAFHCCRAVLPNMMSRNFGRIVNISSMAYRGSAGQTNYSAAKAGLVGMTGALAREAGRFNITCNAIAPGFVVTERLRTRPDFGKLEAANLAQTPLPRVGTPEDVAMAVLFFCSRLADFISGQTLHVNGGRS